MPPNRKIVATSEKLRDNGQQVDLSDRASLSPIPPAGLLVGKPFRCTSTGKVFDRISGEQRGLDITRENLEAAVRIFQSGQTVNIDFNHMEEEPMGRVIDMWVVDDGDYFSLAVLPAYVPEMAYRIERSAGTYWSSPHMVWAKYHDPRTGEYLGDYWIAALAVTECPAQSHKVLDAVAMSCYTDAVMDSTEFIGDSTQLPQRRADEMTPEEIAALQEELEVLRADKEALLEQVATLEAKLEEAQAPAEDAPAEDEGDAPAEEEAPAEDAPADAEDEAPAEGDEEEEEEAMAALRREVASLRKANAKLSANQNRIQQKAAVNALLSAKKITVAEVEKAERAWTAEQKIKASADYKDGDFLPFTEVYGGRPSGSAVPQPKGHAGDSPKQVSKAHTAILDLMASANIENYAEAATRLYASNPNLFYKGK